MSLEVFEVEVAAALGAVLRKQACPRLVRRGLAPVNLLGTVTENKYRQSAISTRSHVCSRSGLPKTLIGLEPKACRAKETLTQEILVLLRSNC